MSAAAGILLGGGILAIKGLGGFHLACDATNQDAVSLLRERKNRWGKPLAIMVGDGAVFPKDDKQVIKIRKDMQALWDDPGGQWHAPEDAPNREKWDTRTPAWVAGLGGRSLHFLVFAVSRYLNSDELVVSCERLLDQTFVRKAQ